MAQHFGCSVSHVDVGVDAQDQIEPHHGLCMQRYDLPEHLHMRCEQPHGFLLHSFLADVRDLLHGRLDSNEEAFDLFFVQGAFFVERQRQALENTDYYLHLGLRALKLISQVTVHLILRFDEKRLRFGTELLIESTDEVPNGALDSLLRPP